jgi:hypothetical protein
VFCLGVCDVFFSMDVVASCHVEFSLRVFLYTCFLLCTMSSYCFASMSSFLFGVLVVEVGLVSPSKLKR